MNLNDKEKQFLNHHRHILKQIFDKRVADLKDQVFTMTKGSERDYMIDFIDEMEHLWSTLTKEEKIVKEDFV